MVNDKVWDHVHGNFTNQGIVESLDDFASEEAVGEKISIVSIEERMSVD